MICMEHSMSTVNVCFIIPWCPNDCKHLLFLHSPIDFVRVAVDLRRTLGGLTLIDVLKRLILRISMRRNKFRILSWNLEKSVLVLSKGTFLSQRMLLTSRQSLRMLRVFLLVEINMRLFYQSLLWNICSMTTLLGIFSFNLCLLAVPMRQLLWLCPGLVEVHLLKLLIQDNLLSAWRNGILTVWGSDLLSLIRWGLIPNVLNASQNFWRKL